jgi:glycosyltransferase involved in cell wall biosynthesis
MNTKKICLVITLPTWGGAQKYVYDMAVALSRLGNEITVVAGQGNNTYLLDNLQSKGIKIRQFSHLVREISPIHDILCIFEMWRFFKREKFSIVHLNSSKAGVIGAIAAKMAGIDKIVYTAHGFVFNETVSPVKKNVYIFLEWFSFLFTDEVITVSNFDYESVKRLNILKTEKLHVIHNGISRDEMGILSREHSREFFQKFVKSEICHDTLIIGTVSNLYPNKGIAYLIETARELKDRFNNIVFLVIGDGPLRSDLQEMINGYALQDIFYLTGFINNPERYLCGFDMYVSPSVKEGLPYSLISASVAGLPIITTNVGGCGEIIDDNLSGLLVPPANVSIMSQKLTLLLRDNKLRMSLGLESRKVSDRFSLEIMVKAVEYVYSTK